MSIERFTELVALRELPLDEAAIALAAAIGPPLDPIEWLARIDALAADCPTPTAAGIARYLFRDGDFRGNSDDYFDWRNSCLDQVLTRKVGIPISLSVLMIEVGRRLGVSLVGANVPGHFLVRTPDEPARFFDPFTGGAEIDRDGVHEMVSRLSRRSVPPPWRRSLGDIVSNRFILSRMLANLMAVFERDGDRARLAIVGRMRLALPLVEPRVSVDIDRSITVWN